MVRFSVELPEEVAEALGRMADERASSPEGVLAALAAEAVTSRAEFRRRIDEGLADIAAGRTHSHEEVMAELEAWVEEVEARQQRRQ
jgi:predicted transcriptional regulator